MQRLESETEQSRLRKCKLFFVPGALGGEEAMSLSRPHRFYDFFLPIWQEESLKETKSLFSKTLPFNGEARKDINQYVMGYRGCESARS